jgi:hypothetical protein
VPNSAERLKNGTTMPRQQILTLHGRYEFASSCQANRPAAIGAFILCSCQVYFAFLTRSRFLARDFSSALVR